MGKWARQIYALQRKNPRRERGLLKIRSMIAARRLRRGKIVNRLIRLHFSIRARRRRHQPGAVHCGARITGVDFFYMIAYIICFASFWRSVSHVINSSVLIWLLHAPNIRRGQPGISTIFIKFCQKPRRPLPALPVCRRLPHPLNPRCQTHTTRR